MNLESLRRFLLGLPHATVRKQWGETLVFKIAEIRMFAVCSLDGATLGQIALKARPEEFDALVQRSGIVPAPYMQRAKWIAINDSLAMKDEELRERLRVSYEWNLAKLTKKERASLGKA